MLFLNKVKTTLVFANALYATLLLPRVVEGFGGKDYSGNQDVDKHCGCMVGVHGTPGVPGVPGNMGPSGEKGSQGEPGSVGPTGPNGARGPRGVKGEKGEVGGLLTPSNFFYPTKEKQNKVAFSAARSQKLGPVAQDTAIVFESIYFNLGRGFNAESSQFVCDIPGVYVFTTHVLGQKLKDAYAWIMMNEKHKAPLHGDGRAGYGTGSQTIILELGWGDRVWVQLSKDSALLNDYSTFSGFLLYENEE